MHYFDHCCVLLTAGLAKGWPLLCVIDCRARKGLSTDDMLVIKLVLAGAFYPNYFLAEKLVESEVNKQMSGFDPSSTVVVKLEAILTISGVAW